MQLIGKDAITINVALQSVANFDEDLGYPVYFVDELLCRGLDMKTSAKIEENGGLYVLIAKIPSSTKVL